MKKTLTSLSLLLIIGVVAFLPTVTFADVTPTVAQSYNQATIIWPLVTGAKCYNIYYGPTSKTQSMWKHSVRCVSNPTWTYTINYLKVGRAYSYTVAALNSAGKEFSWTPVAPLVTSLMVK